jgi:hypothetical protein
MREPCGFIRTNRFPRTRDFGFRTGLIQWGQIRGSFEGEEANREGRPGSLGFGDSVAEAWTVSLPEGVFQPLEVYVNGVRQTPGVDYDVLPGLLRFRRPLAQEGRLGWLRWTSIFLGVAGTYRKHDSVDVIYEVDGRRHVASNLPVVAPDRGP